MRLRTLPIVLLCVLAGCGGPAPTTSSGGADRADLLAAANCMRGNGFPDYPDPVQSNGTWVFPASAADTAPKPAPACAHLFGQVDTHRAVSPTEMTALRKWATCIRAHGLPDWPDPDSAGVFRLTSTPPAQDDPVWQRADTACRSLEPGPIAVDGGPGTRK